MELIFNIEFLTLKWSLKIDEKKNYLKYYDPTVVEENV